MNFAIDLLQIVAMFVAIGAAGMAAVIGIFWLFSEPFDSWASRE
jgi:hypothetical protein